MIPMELAGGAHRTEGSAFAAGGPALGRARRGMAGPADGHLGATRRSRPSTRMRLTLRGKLLIVALVLLLPFLALTASRALATSAQPAPVSAVLVEPGETLWGLAERVHPGGDRRETMARLEQVNELDSGELQPGQRIVVPWTLP